MIEKFEVVKQLFTEKSNRDMNDLGEDKDLYDETGTCFNYEKFFRTDSYNKLKILMSASDHILGLDDGKNRLVKEVSYLSQSFALATPHEEAMAIKDDIAFFQGARAILIKSGSTGGGGKSDFEVESAVKQVIDKALSSDQVVDIFGAAGLQKPEITILSEEFLLEVKNMHHKNLALEVLKKILNDEIKVRTKVNLVQSKKLLEMLESAIKRYQNNILTTTEVIQELLNIAKDIRSSDEESEKLGLSKDEIAFYHALEVNDSAVQVLGDEQLRKIAKEIADKVRTNTGIDWTIRESARAHLMSIVKRTLKKYGYPPDKTQKAIDTVMEQAELMANFITDN
jgi:type I restriction enzyme, R subunit